MSKQFHLLIILLLLNIVSFAQHPNAGMIIGTRLGIAKVNTEITSGFKSTPNEFMHKVAPAFDLELSKLLFDHWELGTDFSITFLRGDTDNPNFSAEGIHPSMLSPVTEPVEYKNQLLGQKVFVGYYFKSIERYEYPFKLEPFIRLGIGYDAFTSQFKYIEAPDNELIFGKNTGKYKAAKLFSNNLFITMGIKSYTSNHLFFTTTFSLIYSDYDFLDVVHNYNADGTHANLRGIYSEIKLGIFYHSNELGKHKSRKGHYSKEVLPFSGK
ncbi:hypothetical protein [uncultured Draconibacterium sp.]|uniref:hypothetical protein n=1 Tax=uncultured Draconibacterium sp. TaxID=1573823 RepID=UPI003216D5C5